MSETTFHPILHVAGDFILSQATFSCPTQLHFASKQLILVPSNLLILFVSCYHHNHVGKA